jgi:hypothetical protein
MKHSCGCNGKSSSTGSNPTTKMTLFVRRKLTAVNGLCKDISLAAVREMIANHSVYT